MSNELKTTEKLTKKDINNAALRYMFMACNTFNYENQQGQRVYVTEVVADNFQMLESRAAREGHSGGSYNVGGFDNSKSFGGGASAGGSFGESQPAQSTPNFGRDESPFGNSNPMDISDDDLPF